MITDRTKIGFVTGLQAEARWLDAAQFMVRAGGGTPAGAEKAALELIHSGAEALVSFGLAGGLEPRLQPGMVIRPEAVIVGSTRYDCDIQLIKFLGGANAEASLAGNAIVASAQEKHALYKASRAIAVDLESGAVAQTAKTNGLPFAVLRAVADPAGRNLPPAALIALKADGRLNVTAIARSILTQPWQIPLLITVGKDASAARKALLEQVKELPVGFVLNEI